MSFGRHQDVNQLATLYYFSNAVHRAKSVTDICELALTALQITLNLDRCSILLLDVDGVQFRAMSGAPDHSLPLDAFFPWSLEIKNPVPLLIPNVAGPSAPESLKDVIVDESVRAVAFVPILDEGRVLGQFALCYQQPHEFTLEEIEIAQTIASHTAYAGERRRVEDALWDSHRLLNAIVEGRNEYAESVSPVRQLIVAGGESPAIITASMINEENNVEDRDRQHGGLLESTMSGADGSDRFAGEFPPVTSECVTVNRMFGIARDLRQRQRLEEALRESEERFRALSACSPVGILMVDPQGRLLYSNARCQSICGFSREEGLGNGWMRFIYSDETEKFSAEWSELLKGGREFRIETRFHTPEGIKRWIEFKATPLFYDAQQVAGYVSTVEDVTARHFLAAQQTALLLGERIARAEAEVRQRESDFLSRVTQELSSSVEYETTLQTLAHLAVSMLADVCVVYTQTENQQFRKMASAVRDPLRSPSLGDYDNALKTAIQSRKRVVIDNGLIVPLVGRAEVFGVILMISTKEPRRQYGLPEIAIAEEFAHRAILALESGQIYRHALEMQRRMTFLAEASKVLMASLTYEAAFTNLARLTVPMIADYCIIYSIDNEGQKLVRMAHAHHEAETEENFSRLLAQTAPLTIESPIGEVARTGRPLIYEDLRKSSRRIFAHEPHFENIMSDLQPKSAVILPIEARGNRLGVVVMGMNGSDRYYAPVDLQFSQEVVSRASLVVDNMRLYAKAQESNRLKEEFLATLSHELRTPLTAIVGYARLLLGRRMDENAAFQAIESIHRNAQLQSQLISDLLDISRIVTGKLHLDMKPVDLNSIIDGALDAVRLAAEAKSHKLHYTSDPFAAQIAGDPDRIRQIIWNLVSNAIKFTPEGGAIEVRLQAMGSYAQIKVSDNGIGLNPEFLPHVFEKFRQADNSDARQNGGLGLGLAIVRHLVEMHGGTVHAESAGPGLGASFTVRLPRQSVAHRRAG